MRPTPTRREVLYLTAVAACAVVFAVQVLGLALQPSGEATGAGAATGAGGVARDVDMERLRRLLRRGHLSEREALFVRPAEEAESTPAPSAEVETIDWTRTTPLDLLETLARRPDRPLTIWEPPPAGWITAAHVEALLARIDETAPAAYVISSKSSYLPFGRTSTVGNEALFLVVGFREGRYPPRLCSVHYFQPDVDEIRRWWQDRRER